MRIWPHVGYFTNSQSTGEINHEEWLHRDCWADSLPQLLLGVLWAVVPRSDCAYTSCCSGRLQALITHRPKLPGLHLYRRQLMPCWSSGAVVTGAAVWFMGKRQRRDKWLLYQIMLCGSPARSILGLLSPKWQGWELWLQGAHGYDFN